MKIRILLTLFTLAFSSINALDFTGVVTPETLLRHRGDLVLTPEQETELTRIYEAAKGEADPLEQAIREESAKLRELLSASELSEEAAAAQLELLLDAEGKYKHLQMKTLVSLRAGLTSEQLAKALTLASQAAEDSEPLETRIKSKADRLKAAFEELDFTPSISLEMRGTEITEMIRRFELAEADQALDALIVDTGIDEPVDTAPLDFSANDPGDTDLEILKQRFEKVTEEANKQISLPLLRQLVKGRDALELAKQNEDATQVGRILTWAEKLLSLP